MKKTAVILFNLGGPDNLEAVKPFLFNLFNDKAIINLPNPLRWLVAKLISSRREKEAKEIYQHLGGKTPLLEQTERQESALKKELNSDKSGDYKIFTVMRYWKPRAKEVIKQLKQYNPEEVILLPLYPQFSTTTTGSSVKEWFDIVHQRYPTKLICCYPKAEGFVKPIAEKVDKAVESLGEKNKVRVLFTAHGLPESIVKKGDPYQDQVDLTVSAIKSHMKTLSKIEAVTCYQSRVGPVEWIKPYTDDEIKRAGKDKVSLVVVPVAFVSEHSETLVELDIEYKELSQKEGVPAYTRVDTVQDDKAFIRALKSLMAGDYQSTCKKCKNNKCCLKNTLRETKNISFLT